MLKSDIKVEDSLKELDELKGKIEISDQTPAAPEDLAASFFRLQQPRLKIILAKLSAKQLRRLIWNSCSYPFVDKAYEPKENEEKQAAYLVHEMVQNKVIMQLHFEMEQANKALNNTNNNPEGENNGL